MMCLGTSAFINNTVIPNNLRFFQKDWIPEYLYRESSLFSQSKSGFRFKACRNDTIRDFWKRLIIPII